MSDFKEEQHPRDGDGKFAEKAGSRGQKRAKKGGEVGPNGEWYPAGSFIATTDMPKMLRRKRIKAADKKVQFERNRYDKSSWVVPKPGQLSILNVLDPFLNLDNSINEKAMLHYKRSEDEIEQARELAGKFGSGERWVNIEDYPTFARFEDLARLAEANKPIPEESFHEMGGGPEEIKRRLGIRQVEPDTKQTDSPEFKNWFGESKVVDEQGEPLRVFHGTDVDFDAFDIEKIGSKTVRPFGNQFKDGFFFSKESSTVKRYGDRLIEAYINVSKPAPTYEEFVSNKEYDGFINSKIVVARNSNQIKSASGNKGSFDPDDERINYSRDQLVERFQKAFDESKVNRDEDGQFAEKAGRREPGVPQKIAQTKITGRKRRPVYLSGSVGKAQSALADKHDDFGFLVQPDTKSNLRKADDYPYFGVDNGGFGGKFNEKRFRSLLDAIEGKKLTHSVMFVAAPDVFDPVKEKGDPLATIEKSRPWFKEIRERGLPPALVAQDGIEQYMDQIPWDDFDVVFMGGGDDWKEGYFDGPVTDQGLLGFAEEVRAEWDEFIDEAHRRGKRIHVGRVNNPERLAFSYAIGADSVDGNYITFAPNINSKEVDGWLNDLEQEETGDAVSAMERIGGKPIADMSMREYRESAKAMQGERYAKLSAKFKQAWAEKYSIWGDANVHGDSTPKPRNRTMGGGLGSGSWKPFMGKRGGRGWVNTATGEKRYQTNKPGDENELKSPSSSSRQGGVQERQSPRGSTAPVSQRQRPAGTQGATGEQRATRLPSGDSEQRPGQDVPADRRGTESDDSKVGRDSGDDAPARKRRKRKPRKLNAGNFSYRDTSDLGGGLKTKFKRNLAALEVIQNIEREGRDRATLEEQEILSKFTGWGQFSEKLWGNYGFGHSDWKQEIEQLKIFMGEDEFDRAKKENKPSKRERAAKRATQNSHFTDPRIVQAHWQIAQRLGFDGGRFLDPSIGSGYYVGMMPPELASRTSITGVELDDTTAKVAKYLYPDATVRNQGFQDLEAPDGFYDLAASNVPFGDYRVHDPDYNRYQANIHDYFFLKSLDKVRPGGLVMHVTSAGTMDKKRDRIRKELAGKADLVAAIRLPTGTHKGVASTEVVTDLLILRKHGENGPAGKDTPNDAQPDKPGFTGVTVDSLGRVYHWIDGKRVPADRWTATTEVPNPDGEEKIRINQYFEDHPDQILGTLNQKGTMYGGSEMGVAPPEDFEAALQAAIERIPEGIYNPDETSKEAFTPLAQLAPDEMREGNLTIQDGKLLQRKSGGLVEVEASSTAIARIEAMLPIVAARRALVNAEMSGGDTTEARSLLNQAYDAFKEKFGLLTDKANRKAIAEDPDAPILASLEKVNKETKEVEKADIFSKDTIRRLEPVEKADTVGEGIGVSLNQKGRIDIEHIAKLTGKEIDEVEDELYESGIAFNDPALGWMPRDEYLSGNVRKKLEEAIVAADSDPRFKANVEALEANQPEDLEYTDISARLGAPWIPTSVIEQFAGHVANTKPEYFASNYDGILNSWEIDSASGQKFMTNTSAAKDWSLHGVNFFKMFDAALNNKQLNVYDTITTEDGKERRVVNREETQEVRQKVQDLKDEFSDWLWEDDDRRQELTDLYNENFNSIIEYEPDGSHLTFPGMTPNINPYDIQRNFVWQMIKRGKGYAGHEVGTGKTITMIASAMELRRLGLAKKPCIVALKPTVKQLTQEALDLYPGAKILSTADMFTKDKRKETVAKIASGDYDMVIMTQEHMNMLPMSAEVQERFIAEEIEECEAAITGIKDSNRTGKKNPRTVKQLEKRKDQLRAKLAKALESQKDDAVTFEETGIDMLFVDEAHNYKNIPLYTSQQMKGIPTSQADRAQNMLMRSRWLQEQTGGRGLCLVSGTPIANTMAELYNLQKYLQPEELRERGLYSFDAWAATFGETVSELEPAITGGYKTETRMAKFTNVADMLKMAGMDLDLQRAETMLDHEGNHVITRPNRTDHAVVTPETASVTAMMADVERRAKAVSGTRPEKGADNALSITQAARVGSVDPRLYDASFPDEPDSKANKCVRSILERYHESNDKGEVKTQLIFSDTGVNKSEKTGFHLYKDIVDKLVEGGIPRDQIADFSKMSDKEKPIAIDKLKRGEMRVGIGSTQKMGTGVNVQDYLSAIHHLDIPYRPGDLEQRNGRGYRKGNKNEDIDIYNYAAEGSLDELSWQIISRKSGFINQAINSKSGRNLREIVEDDTSQLNPEQLMAAASGDTRALRRMELRNDVAGLRKAKDRHNKNTRRIRDNIGQTKAEIKTLTEKSKRHAQDAKLVSDKDFSLTLGHDSYDERPDAEKALKATTEAYDYSQSQKKSWDRATEPERIGTYKGLELRRSETGYVLIGTSGEEYVTGNSLRSVEAVARGISKKGTDAKAQAEQSKSDIEVLEKRSKKEFTRAEDLINAEAALKKLEQEMRSGKSPVDDEGNSSESYAKFDESKIRRDKGGKFAPKNGNGHNGNGRNGNGNGHESTGVEIVRVYKNKKATVYRNPSKEQLQSLYDKASKSEYPIHVRLMGENGNLYAWAAREGDHFHVAKGLGIKFDEKLVWEANNTDELEHWYKAWLDRRKKDKHELRRWGNFQLYAQAEKQWTPFVGPRGGRGWRSSTGEVVYGDRPGTRGPGEEDEPSGRRGELTEGSRTKAREAQRIEQAEAEWQEKKTRSRYFKGWFGDWENDPEHASKVVDPETGEPAETAHVEASQVADEDGEPVLVYHGTAIDFEKFDPDQVNPASLFGPGFYFTQDKSIATEYTEKARDEFETPEFPNELKLQWWKGNITDEDLSAMRFYLEYAKERMEELGNWDDRGSLLLRHLRDKNKEGVGQVLNKDKSAGQKYTHMMQTAWERSQEPEPVVHTCYLNIRKPFDIDDTFSEEWIAKNWSPEFLENIKNDSEIANEIKIARSNGIPEGQLTGQIIYEGYRRLLWKSAFADSLERGWAEQTIRKKLQSLGFDGITHIGGQIMGNMPHIVWIAFEPNQIKSTDNRGTFDNADDRMAYSERGRFDTFAELYARQQGLFDETKVNRDEDGKFAEKSSSAAPDGDDFELKNKPNWAKGDFSGTKGTQRDLLSGLDALPGQQDLFDDVDKEEDSVELAEKEWKKRSVRSKYFKGWFGDWEKDPGNASKVLDEETKEPAETTQLDSSKVTEEGMPVLVHHGTVGDFEAFDIEKADPDALYGPGFYFSQDDEIATEYTGKAHRVWENAFFDRLENNELTDKEKEFVFRYLKRYAKIEAELAEAKRSESKDYEEDEAYWIDFFLHRAAANEDGEEVAEILRSNSDPQRCLFWRNNILGEMEHSTDLVPKHKVNSCYLNIRNPCDDTRPVTQEEANKLADVIENMQGHPDIDAIDGDDSFTRAANQIRQVGEYAALQQLPNGYGGMDVSSVYGCLDRIQNLIGTTRKAKGPSFGDHRPLSKSQRTTILKAAGYDGITHAGGNLRGTKKHKVWIAFSPNQIKSIDNRGTFDPDDDRVSYSKWGDSNVHGTSGKPFGSAAPFNEADHPRAPEGSSEGGQFVSSDSSASASSSKKEEDSTVGFKTTRKELQDSGYMPVGKKSDFMDIDYKIVFWFNPKTKDTVLEFTPRMHRLDDKTGITDEMLAVSQKYDDLYQEKTGQAFGSRKQKGVSDRPLPQDYRDEKTGKLLTDEEMGSPFATKDGNKKLGTYFKQFFTDAEWDLLHEYEYQREANKNKNIKRAGGSGGGRKLEVVTKAPTYFARTYEEQKAVHEALGKPVVPAGEKMPMPIKGKKFYPGDEIPEQGPHQKWLDMYSKWGDSNVHGTSGKPFGAAAPFNEADHPRAPEGSSEGGQFVSKDSSASGSSSKKEAKKSAQRVGAEVLSLKDIKADPPRFQYKVQNIGEQGVTREFSDVEYDPLLAGMLYVWEDPESGETYVINGHHRYEIGVRSGYDGTVPVYFMDAADEKEARALGAIVNIAEGHGTALDAAKFMRDMGKPGQLGVDYLKSKNVSLKGKVAADALLLSGLSDTVFRDLSYERITIGQALAIAGPLQADKDASEAETAAIHDAQNEVLRAVQSSSRKVSDEAIHEMAEDAMASPMVQNDDGPSLFGDDETFKKLMVDRGEVKAAIRKELSKIKSRFAGFSVKGADALASQAGVGEIDRDKALEKKAEATNILDLFETEVRLKGEIGSKLNEIINRAAEEHNGKRNQSDRRKVKDRAKREVREFLKSLQGPESGQDGPVTLQGDGYGQRSGAVLEGSAYRLDRGVRRYCRDGVEKYSKWSPYVGPRGGKGWTNSETGEVVYGDKPGERTAGREASKKKGTPKQRPSLKWLQRGEVPPGFKHKTGTWEVHSGKEYDGNFYYKVQRKEDGKYALLTHYDGKIDGREDVNGFTIEMRDGKDFSLHFRNPEEKEEFFDSFNDVVADGFKSPLHPKHHLNNYDYNNARHSYSDTEDKAQRLAKQSGVDPRTTADFLETWIAGGSPLKNNFIQGAAKELFNTPQDVVTVDGKSEPFRPSSEPNFKTIMKAQYEATQKKLAEAGYQPDDKIRLYRGMKFGKGELPDAFSMPKDKDAPESQELKNFRSNPVSSFSHDIGIAQSFTRAFNIHDLPGTVSVLLHADVPVRDIASIPSAGMGSAGEGEVVVIGRDSLGGESTVARYQKTDAINIDELSHNANWLKKVEIDESGDDDKIVDLPKEQGE